MSMNAGYAAFRAASSRSFFGSEHRPERIDNPYSQNPAKSLWLRGWRKAESEYERGIPFRHNPFPDNEGFDAAEAKRQDKQRAKQKAIAAYRNKKAKFQKPQPKPEANRPASQANINRLNKLNKKYRTVA